MLKQLCPLRKRVRYRPFTSVEQITRFKDMLTAICEECGVPAKVRYRGYYWVKKGEEAGIHIDVKSSDVLFKMLGDTPNGTAKHTATQFEQLAEKLQRASEMIRERCR